MSLKRKSQESRWGQRNAETGAGLNYEDTPIKISNATNGTTVRTITSEYNAASELVSISDPSCTIEYTRDNLGRATSIENVIAGLTPAVILAQVFDAASNRTELNATIGSTADFKNTYSYEAVNRLIDVVQQSQSGGNAVTAKHVKIG